jgi:glycosyltransferase involved in cell wall biosynthesis
VSRTLVIEAGGPLPTAKASDSTQVSALVVSDGRPLALTSFPAPGATLTPELLEAVAVRHGDLLRARAELVRDLLGRLGAAPQAAGRPVTCSVVVCTHRRRKGLRRVVGDLRTLDPPPLEVIVVDNAPGDDPCRRDVEEAGFAYIREDRKGLDIARNTAVRVARGDIIAFTDDDCAVPPGWVRQLCQAFSHPSVAGVAGPAFPLALATPAQVRMEAHAKLWRGLTPRTFDWQTVSPAEAGVIGAGANMAYRRDRLLALGPEPFPPELDAGTPTQSGGDTYVLAALLAAGHRIAYEPQAFVFHDHRSTGEALHRAVTGYGIGLSAALAKLLVEGREPNALRAWWWLIRQYGHVQRRRLAGRADAIDTRLAWNYVHGAVIGPRRWWTTRAAPARSGNDPTPLTHSLGARGPSSAASPAPIAASASIAASADGALTALSVVVPTRGRPAALARCLDALARQDSADPFDVVVVDDAPTGPRHDAPSRLGGRPVRVVRSCGRGAAAARNAGAAAARGDVLLFLDDDVVADGELVASHLARHRRHAGHVAVVGRYAPRPVTRNLVSSATTLWWEDFFARLEGQVTPTFTGLLTGNLSVSRRTWERVGPFREEVPRREDWEWGLRALADGIELVFAPEAAGRHEFELDTIGRLRAAELEGRGDAILLELWPQALAALPAGDRTVASRARAPARRLLEHLWRSPPARAVVLTTLEACERTRARRTWSRIFNHVQGAAYRCGLSAHNRRSPPGPATACALEVDPLDTSALRPPGAIAPQIHVLHAGRRASRLVPSHGTWDRQLAASLAELVPDDVTLAVAVARGWLPAVARRRALADEVELIVAGSDGHAVASALRLAAHDGLDVRVADADPWSAVAQASASPGPALLAVALGRGAFDRRWLDEALVAFEGERVAMAIGAGLPEGSALAPLLLHGVDPARARLAPLGAPPRYVCLRRDMLRRPGVILQAARHGRIAPALVLVEQALAQGALVARRDVHGLPDEGPTVGEQARACAAVLAERAVGDPGARGAIARAALRSALESGWSAAKQPRVGGGAAMRGLAGISLGVLEGAVSRDRRASGAPAGGRPRSRAAVRV